jgi:hypothetical protein
MDWSSLINVMHTDMIRRIYVKSKYLFDLMRALDV